MIDTRPAECRNRLRDEGKAYPRSGCVSCKATVVTGFGKSCERDKTEVEELTERVEALQKQNDEYADQLAIILLALPTGRMRRMGVVDGVKDLREAFDALMFQAMEFVRRVDASDVSTNRTYAVLKKLIDVWGRKE
jgi:hypothetical protein